MPVCDRKWPVRLLFVEMKPNNMWKSSWPASHGRLHWMGCTQIHPHIRVGINVLYGIYGVYIYCIAIKSLITDLTLCVDQPLLRPTQTEQWPTSASLQIPQDRKWTVMLHRADLWESCLGAASASHSVGFNSEHHIVVRPTHGSLKR